MEYSFNSPRRAEAPILQALTLVEWGNQSWRCSSSVLYIYIYIAIKYNIYIYAEITRSGRIPKSSTVFDALQ